MVTASSDRHVRAGCLNDNTVAESHHYFTRPIPQKQSSFQKGLAFGLPVLLPPCAARDCPDGHRHQPGWAAGLEFVEGLCGGLGGCEIRAEVVQRRGLEE